MHVKSIGPAFHCNRANRVNHDTGNGKPVNKRQMRQNEKGYSTSGWSLHFLFTRHPL